jgi:hypothetical protein
MYRYTYKFAYMLIKILEFISFMIILFMEWDNINNSEYRKIFFTFKSVKIRSKSVS